MNEPTYIGNKQTKELHFAAYAKGRCHVDQIEEREEFDDFEQAVASGYQGCGHCCDAFGKAKGRRKYNIRPR